jgi:hypothetical protein
MLDAPPATQPRSVVLPIGPVVSRHRLQPDQGDINATSAPGAGARGDQHAVLQPVHPVDRLDSKLLNAQRRRELGVDGC